MHYYAKGSIVADCRDEAKALMVITSGAVIAFNAQSRFRSCPSLLTAENRSELRSPWILTKETKRSRTTAKHCFMYLNAGINQHQSFYSLFVLMLFHSLNMDFN